MTVLRVQAGHCSCRPTAAALPTTPPGVGTKADALLFHALQAVVAGVGEPDYINRQLMEILAPKTDYLAVRALDAGCCLGGNGGQGCWCRV